MSYYLEPNSYIRDKLKVVSDMSNYVNRKRIRTWYRHDACDLAARKDFIPLTAEVDKLDINKQTSVLTSLNNLKTKVDGLDVVN